jgi:hypothetical protein
MAIPIATLFAHLFLSLLLWATASAATTSDRSSTLSPSSVSSSDATAWLELCHVWRNRIENVWDVRSAAGALGLMYGDFVVGSDDCQLAGWRPFQQCIKDIVVQEGGLKYGPFVLDLLLGNGMHPELAAHDGSLAVFLERDDTAGKFLATDWSLSSAHSPGAIYRAAWLEVAQAVALLKIRSSTSSSSSSCILDALKTPRFDLATKLLPVVLVFTNSEWQEAILQAAKLAIESERPNLPSVQAWRNTWTMDAMQAQCLFDSVQRSFRLDPLPHDQNDRGCGVPESPNVHADLVSSSPTLESIAREGALYTAFDDDGDDPYYYGMEDDLVPVVCEMKRCGCFRVGVDREMTVAYFKGHAGPQYLSVFTKWQGGSGRGESQLAPGEYVLVHPRNTPFFQIMRLYTLLTDPEERLLLPSLLQFLSYTLDVAVYFIKEHADLSSDEEYQNPTSPLDQDIHMADQNQ